MKMEELGVKSEQFLFKMQVAVRKTLEVNAERVGMSKAEYIINLIIDDSPYLKDNIKSKNNKKLKKVKRELSKILNSL